MEKNEIVYQLIIEDVQNVAKQEVNRELTQLEIERIKDCIAENIDWYSAIVDSIQQNLRDEFNRSN